MSHLIALTFPTYEAAEQGRGSVRELGREYLLELQDDVIAEKRAGGSVKLHQAVHLTASGALEGGFLGTLVGLIFLNPLFGLVAGAGLGAAAGALADYGIDDSYMKELAAGMRQDEAVLFLLVGEPPTDKALARMAELPARVVHTSLASTDEARLRAALAEIA